MIKTALKKILSPRVRLAIRVSQRHLKDFTTGTGSKLVNFSEDRKKQGLQFSPKIIISQPIYTTAFSENKIHNLKLAIQRIENLIIQPGEIFSFWHLVGQPNQSQGYLIGRSLIENEVRANYGGGLCQLSGLLYFLAIKGGLKIIERASHSLDIYTNETRFSPLGSDATVVYGYKDLRLENSLDIPICFRVEVTSNQITGMLCALAPIFEYKIEFREEKVEDGVKVETLRFGTDGLSFEVINRGFYQS